MLRVLLVLTLLGGFAAQATAQERDWLLDVGSDEAYLIFGVPDTDDVGVSLWCPLNKGIVNLYLPRPAREFKNIKTRDVPLKVTAGREKVTFRGKLDAPPDSAVAVVELEIPATHPLLAAMPSADRLTIQFGKQTLIFPIYGADVAGLVELCQKR
jgi:hypothetical protein